MEPLVSILLPTFNQREYVAETLQSCLAQTWPSIEIMVADDASVDGTWDVIAPFAEANPEKIKAIRNPRNLGVSANCNQLLRQMKGTYVALFSGDDLMYPDKIKRQVEYLEQNPNVGICAHDMHIITNDSRSPVGKWSDTVGTYSGGVELLFRHLCFMCGCSLMVRRMSIPSRGYLESIVASDWLLFVEILLKSNHEIHTLNDVLGAYRRRPGQLTGKDASGLSNVLDHGFACGFLHSEYPHKSSEIAICLREWKMLLTREMQNNAVWDLDISQAQLESPRWLLRRFIQAVINRLVKKRGC